MARALYRLSYSLPAFLPVRRQSRISLRIHRKQILAPTAANGIRRQNQFADVGNMVPPRESDDALCVPVDDRGTNTQLARTGAVTRIPTSSKRVPKIRKCLYCMQ